jgi:fructuronate reductase
MTTARPDPPRLSRAGWPGAAAARPVGIVHLGTGNFSRAHQAWYTARTDPAWGIAAFSGRGGSVAAALAEQGGLYTLIERGGAGDELSVIDVISEAHDGRDLAALNAAVAARSTAVVTLTVTEAGYAVPDPAAGVAAGASAAGGVSVAAGPKHRPGPGRGSRKRPHRRVWRPATDPCAARRGARCPPRGRRRTAGAGQLRQPARQRRGAA